MTFYKLPSILNEVTIDTIKLKFDTTSNKEKYIDICTSLSSYLGQVKNEIENYYTHWDNFKKYTNPYEFIHTPLPGYNYSISKYKPISRAFFKLVEIYNTHKILDYDHPIKTFHLAEGPGGFIEATNYLRNNDNDKYYGITLIDKNSTNIPGWKKSQNLLEKNSKITIEYGADNTGDLYNADNFKYLHKFVMLLYYKKKMVYLF